MKTTAVEKVSGTHKSLETPARCAAIFCALLIIIISARFTVAATYTVTSNADSGGGSLRQAILDANARSGADDIVFSIGAFSTIAPTSSLPAITDQLTIGSGSVYYLDGSAAGPSGIGLRISAPNCVVQGQIITRFQEAGIRIDTNANNTVIKGNYIGTNNLSGIDLGNFNRGILIVGTTGNIIGGTSAFDRNIISGNLGTGISITGGGAATISGNYIGTNIDGTADLGNSQEGIRIVDSSNSTIGGNAANTRNVIAGNDGSGISVIQSGNATTATRNIISANYIGVNAGGNTALPNNGSGVLINAAGNTVGGATVLLRNIISANSANGVSLGSNFSTGNLVAGNYIGVGADGTTSLGNRANGVQISGLAANNTIGGTETVSGSCSENCNVIANNGDPTNSNSARAGIYIDSTGSAGNALRANSIYANTGIGIDLGTPGATANDANDPDTGANNLQNFPVINVADTRGNITGTLNSLPNTTFAIDFYRNDSASDEARTYIGTRNVTTNSVGNATFDTGTGTSTLAVGQMVTATATNISTGDTSELAATVPVTAATGNAPAGLESDVVDRPAGDGVYRADDPQQVERFLAAADVYDPNSNEFQRADAAPYASRGDGVLTIADVQQAERYLVSADRPQSAGGPSTANRGVVLEKEYKNSTEFDLQTNAENPSALPRVVRVVNTNSFSGQMVTVPISVDTDGTETGFSFTLDYNPAVLSNPVINAGDLGGTQFTVISPQGMVGKITFSLRNFAGPNGTIAAVNNGIIVRVQFTVSRTAQPGMTPLTFSGTPTANSVTNAAAQNLPANFNPGTVTIAAPRTVRVVNTSGSAAAMITVPIAVDAVGDETGFSFTLDYNPAILTNTGVTVGNAGGSNLEFVISPEGMTGKTTVSIRIFPGANGTIAPGTRTLVNFQFTVSQTAQPGMTPLTFSGTPTANSVTNAAAQNLPANFNPGNVTIAGVTAALVSIGGHVRRADGVGIRAAFVTLLNAETGESITVNSGRDGSYRFDNIQAGQSYIISVQAFNSAFDISSKYVSVSDNLTDIDFTAVRKKGQR